MRYLLLLFLIFFSLASFGQENKVFLLANRKDAYTIRHDVIQEEKSVLRYNTFVFHLDETGQSVVGLLAEAAQKGVKVKLIIDGMGEAAGLEDKGAYLGALKKMGVDIKVFNPLLRHPLSINNRNHQKSLISSKKLLVGGRNTKGDYFNEYIDTEILVKGSEVDAAAKHFDSVFDSPEVKPPWILANDAEIDAAEKEIRAWGKKANEMPFRIRKLEYIPVEDAKYVADPANLVEKRENGINKKIIAMIDRAEKELSLMNPYVYLSDDVKEAFERAIKRGVKIRIATNSKDVTDSRLAAIAWEVKKHELTEMGIEVHESKRYVHAKTIVRDGKEVFIGSFNLDVRSYHLNLENGIFIHSKKLADMMQRHHRRMISIFMKKMEKKAEEKLTSAIAKTTACIRKGYHKLLTNFVWPHL